MTSAARPVRTAEARQQMWGALRHALEFADDGYLRDAMTVDDDSEDLMYDWARRVGHHANRALDLLAQLQGEQ